MATWGLLWWDAPSDLPCGAGWHAVGTCKTVSTATGCSAAITPDKDCNTPFGTGHEGPGGNVGHMQDRRWLGTMRILGNPANVRGLMRPNIL